MSKAQVILKLALQCKSSLFNGEGMWDSPLKYCVTATPEDTQSRFTKDSGQASLLPLGQNILPCCLTGNEELGMKLEVKICGTRILLPTPSHYYFLSEMYFPLSDNYGRLCSFWKSKNSSFRNILNSRGAHQLWIFLLFNLSLNLIQINKKCSETQLFKY